MNKIQVLAGVVVKELLRRKDAYVLFVIVALITLLMGSVNVFNDDKIVRYLKELCLLLIWIASLVIAITTAARQIPFERESRTIFPLLAKPVSRAELLLGKFLGCWIATGIALAAFYVFFAVVAASREHAFPALNYFQAFTLHWMMLAIVIAFTLLGSLVFTAPSVNTTITLILTLELLLGRHLNKIAAQLPGLPGAILSPVYFAIPHLELFDIRDLIIHNWKPIAWWAWAAASLYAAGYAAFFLGSACLVFRRKPVN
jgi:ABC-type transport system involved in multi-copper enzyme maturation permease subunit